MRIAIETSSRSTCFSDPKGAVIVNEGCIISTGYNGAPSGIDDCKNDIGECYKRKLGYKSGEGNHVCIAVHAEANAIILAAKQGVRISNATLYCTHKPCNDCAKLIINSGIKEVVYVNEYPGTNSHEMFGKVGIRIRKVEVYNNE